MLSVLRVGTTQCLLALCACLTVGPASTARKSDLGGLNEQLANKIVKAKLRSVIIVDFQDPLGRPSTLGWYVADELSENWLAKKQKFRVLDRSELKDTRAPEDLTPEMLKRLGSVWGVDAIITGTVETSPERYFVTTTLRNVADDTTIATESIAVPHSRILDLLKPLPDSNSGGTLRIEHAGINGADVPRCMSCPVPGYSERGRAAKIQGTIILSVLISEEGRVERISVAKGLGFGLTQKAIESVSEWRFKPATKEAKPVVVGVPIEVTMRLN